jgi:hypothetical protein
MMPRHWSIALLLTLGCAPGREVASSPGTGGDSEYLYLWTGSVDSTQPDFLAVLDVRPDTGRYGALVSTVPVPGRINGPHHTEHELAADGLLFANGFGTGKTFIFDVRDGSSVKLAGEFGEQDGYGHPHSFLRLPNGNVLGTFQMRHTESGMLPGGLVEMTTAGALVRSSSAMGPGVSLGLRPYSGQIVPALDRIVTSTTDMDETNPYKANQLQIWRLSDLALLHTITLPQGPRRNEADFTAEPRLLGDGRTLLVSTFNCGLYLLEGLDGDAPTGRLVSSFPLAPGTDCAIPVVAGRYWVTTVTAIPAVVSLDISDPANPRETSRLVFDSGAKPHWLGLEPNTRRMALTGGGTLRNRVVMIRFDSATGILSLDSLFREPGATQPGFVMDGRTWPHGSTAPGRAHGAVFSRSRD